MKPLRSQSDKRSTRDHFAAITGAFTDPALVAVLEGLREPDEGEKSAVWSVLGDDERLRAVEETGLLEPGPHPAVNQIVAMTVEAVGIPYAALNMVTDDKQVTAGMATRAGEVIEGPTIPLSDSLCVYTVASGSPLVVDDLAEHPVLAEHSAVEFGIAAYIGIPIDDDAGQTVGTLCAWDTRPHHWSSGEIQIMTDLAFVVRDIIFKR